MKPYQTITIDDNTFDRIFSLDVLSEELVWHRDKKDRTLLVLEGENWSIQFDNFMPEKLIKDEEYYIPKNTYHRVIKGSSSLKVRITEL